MELLNTKNQVKKYRTTKPLILNISLPILLLDMFILTFIVIWLVFFSSYLFYFNSPSIKFHVQHLQWMRNTNILLQVNQDSILKWAPWLDQHQNSSDLFHLSNKRGGFTEIVMKLWHGCIFFPIKFIFCFFFFF